MKDLRTILYMLGACIAISLTSCANTDPFQTDVIMFNHQLYELKQVVDADRYPYTSKFPDKINEFIDASSAQYYLMLDEMFMKYKKPEEVAEIKRLRLRLELLLTKHETKPQETDESSNDSSFYSDYDTSTE